MAIFKSPLFKLAFGLSVPLAIMPGLSILITQPAGLAQGLSSQLLAQDFDPGKVGAPGRRESGASRSGASTNCPASTKRLTALVPVNSYTKTMQGYPTFFFSIPPELARVQGQEVEFVLQDDKYNELYKANYKLGGGSNIVSINLPEYSGVKPLEVNKDYRWSFAIVCNPDDRAGDYFTDGLIRRVALRNQGKQVTPNQQFQTYFDNQIWQDALNDVMVRRRANPNDAVALAQWKQLLKSLSLENIAQ